MGRRSKAAARKREDRSIETTYVKSKRLKECEARMRRVRSQETSEKHDKRLQLCKERMRMVRSQESSEKHDMRVSDMREYMRYKLLRETQTEKIRRFAVIHERLSHETPEHKFHRFSLITNRVSNESNEEYSRRLSNIKNRNREILRKERDDERHDRLQKMRQVSRNIRKSFNAEAFRKAINVFADTPCTICRKNLYPQQRFNLNVTKLRSIVPVEIIVSDNIITCSRCSNNLKKFKVPPQAFWNNMEISAIPNELSVLSEIEKRLLSRIVPFLRIIKVQNRFSQDWFKGQVILFAQDVIELAEQLPLRPSQAGVIIVSESLENIQNCKEFEINIGKLQSALQWLIINNDLYKDVKPHFVDNINIIDILQISDSASCRKNTANVLETNKNMSKYVMISENVAILRGSFHQASDKFAIDSRGKQCTGIATIACVAFSTLDPHIWSVSDIDYILIVGDKYYKDCISARDNVNEMEAYTDYLAVNELLPNILYNNSHFVIDVIQENAINGHLINDDTPNGFPNLRNALVNFFHEYKHGILTCNLICVAIYCQTLGESGSSFYWLFDSHSRGPKGFRAPLHGVSCCIRFRDIDNLYDILRRNLYCKSGVENRLNVFSLTPLMVDGESRFLDLKRNEAFVSTMLLGQENSHILETHKNGDNRINERVNILNENENIQMIFSTSMLHCIDEGIPEVENVVSVEEDNDRIKLANLRRKTAPPLNIEKESRMEELAWFHMFPDGKNGFGEKRPIPITSLDYFQARILGNDSRFYRTDYLFFALSIVEYFRAKSSVSVSCRMRQGERTPQGLIDNIHLTMRNIRGSAAYWKRVCSELIAMVRTLGPPTWFLSFSCNDLNWLDMLKALLIADKRNANEAASLNFAERMKLVQRHPVVIARQFTVRVNALIRYLKNNPDLLGGPIEDYWYRIEFQNRGSPHLHMLVWCTGIPDFSTKEGIEVIEKVVSCSLDIENESLRNIVESVQIHKHTNTCYKDRNQNVCRFGYPRPVSETTTCLEPDQALRNNGRYCILKRTLNETMVNNYNTDILMIWGANMDIQPCGTVEAVAYYVAKYASKCEPNECSDVVKEAVLQAKKRGGPLWNQLFPVTMAIISQRLVSACECAYRLCHLPLKMCTRKTVFINSCLPEQRFRLLRLEGDENSVYYNIFDRYVQRPDNLEDLSLAEFAVRYETISNIRWTEEDGDIELNEELNVAATRHIVLKDKTRMHVRDKPAVLRTRYYTLNSDREGYFYNLIVCHIPFRNERLLMLENETAEACFLRRKSELRPLLTNLTTEQFAYAEEIIQQTLAQAVAFNAVRKINEIVPNDERLLHADEQIMNDNDEFCDDNQNGVTEMPDDVFTNGIQGLNVQQKELFQRINAIVEKEINLEEVQMLEFITGGAGSGKSFVLKLVVEHIRRCYAPNVDLMLRPIFIEVAALTGVAARQIHGKTLHSVFSLPVEKGSTMTYRQMTGQRLAQERKKWRYIRWLIIDEISMVSYENIRIIHLRLQEFKNNYKLFGGVNILLFGDIMQLPPVKGHWCFVQPNWCQAEINLWHQFSFCELTINMRQRNDVEFVDLLNNLRFGELTIAQLELLCERRRIPLIEDFADDAAVRIFPTIKLVNEYNNKMTSMNARSSRIYNINSVNKSCEISTYGKKPPDNVIPVHVNNCGGLLHSIKVSVGSRVMLRRNISLSHGLVNGAMGIIKGFKWPALRRDQLEDGELPDSVLIQFNDDTIGRDIQDSDGYIAIAPVTATFQGTKGFGDIERRMLPIILSWAVTVHKLQGVTLNKAVIDLGKKNFAKGQVYVALSRVKTLDGLAISDLEPNKLLNKPHDVRSYAEMQRLRSLPRSNN